MKVKRARRYSDVLAALEKAGEPREVEVIPEKFGAKKVIDIVGGLTPYELEEIVGDNWASYFLVRELQAEGLMGYKVQSFGDYGRYYITDLGRRILAQLRTK